MVFTYLMKRSSLLGTLRIRQHNICTTSGTNVNTYNQSTVVFPIRIQADSDGLYYFTFSYPNPQTAYYPVSFYLNQTYTTVSNVTTTSSSIKLPFSPEYLAIPETLLGLILAVVARQEQKMKEKEDAIQINPTSNAGNSSQNRKPQLKRLD